jgi:Ca2+-binding RTX toxin-like protein
MNVPTTFFASAFRNPLGNGLTSPENDGDGYYVAFGFDEPNPDIGGSFHLGADWNGEGFGNTDLGDPVFAIGNATIVAVVSDQGSATTGFGNYVVLRHDLPEPTLINGQSVTQVHSLYAHLDTVSALSVGQQIGIGTQIGTLGMSGYADVAHLHLEITIGSVLPTSDDGYNPGGAPSSWVDPVAFIAQRLDASSPTEQLSEAEQRALDVRHAAMLANLAYSNNPNTDAGQGWTLLSRSQLGMTQAEWDNDASDSVNSQLVFDIDNGQAIVARNGNSLSIAFRGSEEGGDFFDDLVGGAYSFGSHYVLFSRLISNLHSYAAANGITDILVAGHSLGGAMVEYFMGEYWDTGSISYSGVSFGSPGVQEIINNPGSDGRLFNIGHSGDPVFRASLSESIRGVDVLVNLPAETDLSLAQLVARAAFGDLGEHSGQLYNNTAIMLTWSLPLFSQFVSTPSAYTVTITGNGNYTAGALNDYIIGGFDASQILGGLGNDLIFGNTGDDILSGQNGSDWIDGGRGADRLFGGQGTDFLAGGEGSDISTGGSQADVFAFSETDFPVSVGPVPQDRITDYNRGTGTYASAEGDLIDLTGVRFATGNGFGTTSLVRLRSVEAGGGLPAGAVLEVLTAQSAEGDWRAIARLDGVTAGESIRIALTDDQAASRTGTVFVVDAVTAPPSWSITPSSQTVVEGNVTLTFTITRTGTNLGAEVVYVSTWQGHGHYNDRDYTGFADRMITFAAGDTSETVTIQILGDSIAEGAETFGLIVQRDQNDLGSILTRATFTITDNDTPVTPPSGTNFVGTSANNTWTGTAGTDYAEGLGGNDSLYGGAAADGIYGGDGNDLIRGGSGSDYLDAGVGLDRVYGDDGDDTVVVGPGGRDSLYGGLGFDTLYLDRSTSTSNLSLDIGMGRSDSPGGSDTLEDGTIVDGFEVLTLTTGSGNDTATFYPVAAAQYFYASTGTDRLIASYSGFSAAINFGWQGDRTAGREFLVYASHPTLGVANAIRSYGVEEFDITGGTGNDSFDATLSTYARLIGGAGNDYLASGNGNDSLVGGTGNDSLYGGTGRDSLYGENGNDTLLAGDGHDMLFGGNGHDTLDGGVGNDTMLGGAGNDVYLVNTASDRVFETTTTASAIDAGGSDVVQSAVTFNLDASAGVRFVENLVLTGIGNTSGTGNALANRVTGNAGNNVLNGGLGNDTMIGGVGNDTFVFNTALGAGNVDRITDFTVTDDTIRLDDAIFVGLAPGSLAVSAFAANLTGTAADGLDRIIYETDTGRVYFDADGSGAGARVHFATLTSNLAVTSMDFFVF